MFMASLVMRPLWCHQAIVVAQSIILYTAAARVAPFAWRVTFWQLGGTAGRSLREAAQHRRRKQCVRRRIGGQLRALARTPRRRAERAREPPRIRLARGGALRVAQERMARNV